MTSRTPRELWEEYCEVAPGIRAQFGLPSAIGYVVGEKLMAFAHIAETNPEFRAELPAFCTGIRKLFTRAELQQHFTFVDRETQFETGLLEGNAPEEIENLKDVWKDLVKTREQRAWVKAMLLQTGS